MSNQVPTLTSKFYDDVESKQLSSVAKLAVLKYNEDHADLFTADEKAKGAELLAQAQAVFIRSRCFLNYRAKSMVVKVEKVKAADKLSEGYEAFEKSMAELNANNKHLNGNYLFHIFPR